ncbi:MAG TPA: UrcA family protein [Aliidongia sp.]|nr:UrcA family protein [Aliidongia sp.]
MFPRVRIVALSAALLISGFSLAHAGEVTKETIIGPVPPLLERHAELVMIGDLDLRSEDGQAMLMQRLHHAAKDVCDPFVDRRILLEMEGFHVCYDTAMADATAKARTFLASAANTSLASLVVARPASR